MTDLYCCRSSELPGPTLLHLTRLLHKEAQGLLGAPMMHDLALAATTLFQTAITQPDKLQPLTEPVQPAAAALEDRLAANGLEDSDRETSQQQSRGRAPARTRTPRNAAK